jgi:hypothetical protein
MMPAAITVGMVGRNGPRQGNVRRRRSVELQEKGPDVIDTWTLYDLDKPSTPERLTDEEEQYLMGEAIKRGIRIDCRSGSRPAGAPAPWQDLIGDYRRRRLSRSL